MPGKPTVVIKLSSHIDSEENKVKEFITKSDGFLVSKRGMNMDRQFDKRNSRRDKRAEFFCVTAYCGLTYHFCYLDVT